MRLAHALGSGEPSAEPLSCRRPARPRCSRPQREWPTTRNAADFVRRKLPRRPPPLFHREIQRAEGSQPRKCGSLDRFVLFIDARESISSASRRTRDQASGFAVTRNASRRARLARPLETPRASTRYALVDLLGQMQEVSGESCAELKAESMDQNNALLISCDDNSICCDELVLAGAAAHLSPMAEPSPASDVMRSLG